MHGCQDSPGSRLFDIVKKAPRAKDSVSKVVWQQQLLRLSVASREYVEQALLELVRYGLYKGRTKRTITQGFTDLS